MGAVRHTEFVEYVVSYSAVLWSSRKNCKLSGPSASNGEHCVCIVFDLYVVRSCLELFCFLSFVSFVLRHLYSRTHRIYQTMKTFKNWRQEGNCYTNWPRFEVDSWIDLISGLNVMNELCSIIKPFLLVWFKSTSILLFSFRTCLVHHKMSWWHRPLFFQGRKLCSNAHEIGPRLLFV